MYLRQPKPHYKYGISEDNRVGTISENGTIYLDQKKPNGKYTKEKQIGTINENGDFNFYNQNLVGTVPKDYSAGAVLLLIAEQKNKKVH